MILTKRLYEDQSYLTRCEAKVLEVYRAEAGKGSLWEVIVDRSVFFPEGGGQSPDRGWIFSGSEDSSEPGCAYEVTDVQIEGGVIRHTIDIASENALSGAGDGAAPTLHAGDTVTLQIDWERRFGFMQNHTGEHILSGLMHNRYGFDNIGFHLSDNSVTLDVNGQLDEEQLLQLEWEANEVVYRNLPVVISYPDDEALGKIPYRSKKEIEGRVRIVTIPDVDICACCAPHVKNTGEIGMIKIVRFMRWGDGTRLTIECGRRAFATVQSSQFILEEISHLTNRSRSECADGVRYLLAENGRLREKNRELSYEAAELRLAAIPRDAVNAYLFAEEMDAVVQRNLVNRLMEEHEGVCGVFIGSDGNGYRYVIGSHSEDVRKVQAVLREKCGAKGGGKAVMVQGSAAAGEELLRKALPEG